MADAVLEMEARLKNFISAELVTLQKDLKKTDENVQNTTKSVKKSEDAISSLAKTTRTLAGAFGLAFGTQQVIRFFQESIAGAKESIQMEAKLTAALGFRSEMLQRNASAMQQLTTYDDEAIMGAQALVANFVKEEETIRRLMPAIVDMAAAKGMDLGSAADLVTKSIVSETNALGRYGIQLNGAAGSSERVTSAINNLNRAFGGQAQALAQTDVGKIQQTLNLIGDIKEEIGMGLLPLQREYYQLVLDTLNGWKQIFGVFKSEAVTDRVAEQAKLQQEIWKSEERLKQLANPGLWLKNEVGQAGNMSIAEMVMNPKRLDELIQQEKQKVSAHIEELKSKRNEMFNSGKEELSGKKNTGGGIITSTKEQSFEEWAIANGFPSQANIDYVVEQSKKAQELKEKQQEEYLAHKDDTLNTLNEQLKMSERLTEKEKDESEKRIEQARRESEQKQQLSFQMARMLVNTLEMVGKASRLSADGMKAIRIGEVWIDNASAQASAARAIWSQSGGTWQAKLAQSIAISAALTAQGMAQSALISRQKFAGGGIVSTGASHGDSTLVGVNRNEMILNPVQQGNLFSMLNRASDGGSRIQVVINASPGANVDASAVQQIEEMLVQRIGPSLLRAESEGRLEDFKRVVTR